jgi:hypothetical protein
MANMRMAAGMLKAAIESAELIDWLRVLKYFAITLAIIVLAGLVAGLWIVLLALFFMPIWFIIWFFALYFLGLFKKT